MSRSSIVQSCHVIKNHVTRFSLTQLQKFGKRAVYQIHIDFWNIGFTKFQNLVDQVTLEMERVKNKFAIAAPDALCELLLM